MVLDKISFTLWVYFINLILEIICNPYGRGQIIVHRHQYRHSSLLSRFILETKRFRCWIARTFRRRRKILLVCYQIFGKWLFAYDESQNKWLADPSPSTSKSHKPLSSFTHLHISTILFYLLVIKLTVINLNKVNKII